MWAIVIGGLAIVLVAVPLIAYFKKQAAPGATPPAPGNTGPQPTANPLAKPQTSTPANTDLAAVPPCRPGDHLEVDANGNMICVSDLPSQITDPNIPLLPPSPPAFSSGVTSGSPGVDTGFPAEFFLQGGA
jgi:hypothetical protein